MSEYDQQYYFIRPTDNENNPVLTPDTNTEDSNYSFEEQLAGSPPLVFFNGAKEYQEKMRIPRMKVPPEILFDGANLLVPCRLREALLEFDIPNLHFHPAVYIHDDGKWFEDYWYMALTERFDCWDRNNSNYDQDDPPIRLGGFELYHVYTYSINKELLDKTPLEQRLLFQMGATIDPFFVCHKSLARLFCAGENSGVQLTLIPNY